MKLIMAKRLDPRGQFDPEYVQLSLNEQGEMRTKWGLVVSTDLGDGRVRLHIKSDRSESVNEISAADLARLHTAADWIRLPDDAGPLSYTRSLPGGSIATLALRPDPSANLRGDYMLLTIYQASHWLGDGSIVATWNEFVSGEGSELAFDEASTWSQRVEAGEIAPTSMLRYTVVPLALGMTARVLNGGLNSQRVGGNKDIYGKEVTLVELTKEGGGTLGPDGDWRGPRWWSVEFEGKRLQFSMEEGKEISANYFTLEPVGSPLNAIKYMDTERGLLYSSMRTLVDNGWHGTLSYADQAALKAWHPNWRILG